MSLVSEKDLPPKLRDHWKKASEAVKRQNWEYAASFLELIVQAEPNCLDARKLLRHSRIKQFEAKGGKKSFLSLGNSMGKAKAAAKKDFAEGFWEIEKTLAKEPFSIEANKYLYELGVTHNMLETAEFGLETIVRGDPKNVKVMHQLAEHYMANEKPDEAFKVYEAILKVEPTDLKAQTSMTHASARSSMLKTGMEKEGTDMRSMLANADEAKELEASNRAGMTKEQIQAQLAQWSEKYNEDQTNLEAVKKIASLYEQLNDWANAHSFYAYAAGLSPGDTSLEQKALTAETKFAEAQIKELEDQLKETDNPEQRDAIEAQIAETRRNRAEHTVVEAQARVERNPTDPHLRLELARNLYFLGQHSEAIPHLQRARTNPAIRAESLLLLGRTYEAKNMNDLAASQYQEALADMPTMDATKKDLLYQLALVYEKQGNEEEYIKALKEIYGVDYHFRDVASRVEASYA